MSGKKVEIGAMLSKSWGIVKAELGFYVVGFLAVMLVGGITGGILTGPLMVGFFMAINKKMKGEQCGVGDIFNMGFSKFVPALVATILIGFAYMIGLILLVIPGILVMIFASFTMPILAEKDIDGIAAIKESVALVKGNFGTVFVHLLVAGLIGGLGSIACYIGMFVTMPIAVVWIVLLYKELNAAPVAA